MKRPRRKATSERSENKHAGDENTPVADPFAPASPRSWVGAFAVAVAVSDAASHRALMARARSWREGIKTPTVRGDFPVWWAMLMNARPLDATGAMELAYGYMNFTPMDIGAQKRWWFAGLRQPVPYALALASIGIEPIP